VPSSSTLVHELAHQWFGDSVTPRDWGDIWLNEGFATYAEWLWEERRSPGAAKRAFDELYEANGDGDPFWTGVVAAPDDASQLFNTTRVYLRGAMTLEALRLTIGRADFFELLREWPRAHRHAGATTAALERLAERVSGESLDPFFSAWLHNPGRPAGF
jgi:aminopeptidase N